MQSRTHDAHDNGRKYSGERAGDVAMFSNTHGSTGSSTNHTRDVITRQNDESTDEPLLFKDALGKLSYFDPHGDSGKALDMSYQSLRREATEQKELGLISDLIKLGRPREQQDNDPNDIVGYPNPNHNGSRWVGDGEAQTPLYSRNGDVGEGHVSGTTVLTQTTHQIGSVPTGAAVGGKIITPNGMLSQNLGHRLLEGAELDLRIDTASKKSDKIKGRNQKTRSVSTSENILHESQFSSSPTDQPAKSTTKHRSRNDSHPGSLKYVRPSSRAGVLSDDEYIINTSAYPRHGRRSAPIFTKRGFSASGFWNSGQTVIERTRLQDLANARQRAKSPTANFVGKLPISKNNGRPILRRPHSVDPISYLNSVNQDSRENEHSESSFASENRHTGRGVTYGSTDNSTRRVDHRGYHSEIEGRHWRLQNVGVYPPKKQDSVRDSLQFAGRLAWTDEDGEDKSSQHETRFDSHDSSDSARERGMRGVFRTSRAVSPRVLQAKVDRGKDATTLGKNSYGYLLDNEVAEFSSQAAILAITDKNIVEEGSDEGDETASVTGSSNEEYMNKYEIKAETRTEVYKRRWYLLALFSVCAMMWNAIWSTWGPIAQSAKGVYNWNDGDIAMFTYLGNIPFLITMFPCAYLMDVSGMRIAMIFCCGFMFAGAGFRCIPGDIYTSTWLIRIGQTLNGMAGTIPSSAPALLSALWFPPNQRATATAISTVAGYMGASISFVIGPLLVPEPDEISPVNGTVGILSDDFDNNSSSSNATDFSAQEKGIKSILYGECGLAGLLLILVLIYFPSKPPLPPSISASIPREKYLNGLKLLVRNKQFWICAIAFSVPIGVYESWQVVLDINLDSKGISQQTAGWLDFYATLGGCVSGLLVSRFADLFIRQMKLFLLVFYSFATVAILWLTIVVLDIIPFDQVSIYAATILAGIFLDGGSPLFFEITIEVSYPVGEGVTSGFTHMMCAAAGTIFLVMVQIESLGTQWMNWCFLGCVALTIPLLLFINTTYSRADIDELEVDISEDEEDITGIGAADTDEKTSLLKNSTV